MQEAQTTLNWGGGKGFENSADHCLDVERL